MNYSLGFGVDIYARKEYSISILGYEKKSFSEKKSPMLTGNYSSTPNYGSASLSLSDIRYGSQTNSTQTMYGFSATPIVSGNFTTPSGAIVNVTTGSLIKAPLR